MAAQVEQDSQPVIGRIGAEGRAAIVRTAADPVEFVLMREQASEVGSVNVRLAVVHCIAADFLKIKTTFILHRSVLCFKRQVHSIENARVLRSLHLPSRFGIEVAKHPARTALIGLLGLARAGVRKANVQLDGRFLR